MSATGEPISIKEIQSGDLLIWTRNPYSPVSDFIIRTIGVLTKSDYGHVGIAWKLGDLNKEELFVVEATIPEVAVNRVTEDRHFYCVQADVMWEESLRRFLLDHVRMKYGYENALRALWGKKARHDDRVQCAELCHGFFEKAGVLLPEEYRPKDVVQNLSRVTGNPVRRVILES